jgi:hypothetical protein
MVAGFFRSQSIQLIHSPLIRSLTTHIGRIIGVGQPAHLDLSYDSCLANDTLLI